MFSLFRYFAFVISLCRLRYFVMSPLLFRLFVFSLSSFRLFAFVFSSFRYGAFVMSPRNNEKTKWHKSATILGTSVLKLMTESRSNYRYLAASSNCLQKRFSSVNKNGDTCLCLNYFKA